MAFDIYCEKNHHLKSKRESCQKKKTRYLPLIPGSFAVLERLGVVMLDGSEQVMK